ncbi:MAG: hypothetical protein FWD36_10355 [Treponema sp.]|nr:hypothetical protein [Treponema sp.]
MGNNVPSWGLSRWAGNTGLRFIPLDDEGFAVRSDRRWLLYKGRRRSHRFTILGDTSFEYDCILNREPESNVIALQIEGAECYDFFRQPDFVKDPFLKGSYAVYKKETLIGEGTGKLCHIHRPLIIDARGRKVWGDLAVVGNELRITIPEQWLAEAKYPVVVDPTIGTTTVGKQQNYDQLIFYQDIAVNRFYIPETINGPCTAFAYTIQPDDIYACSIVYSDNSNKPLNKLSKNEDWFSLQIDGDLDDWRSGAFELKSPLTGGSYIWFGFLAQEWYPFFDYGSQCYYTETYSIFKLPETTFPSPMYYTDAKLSMYFTYTNAQNYVRTLTQGVKLTDTRNLKAGYQRVTAQIAKAADDKKLKAEYQRTSTQIVQGTAAIARFQFFFRQCVINVANSMNLTRAPTFLRTAIEWIGIESEISNNRNLTRNCDETTAVCSNTKREQGFFSAIHDIASGTDQADCPVVFVRSIEDMQGIADTIGQWGAYIRGLYDEAGNTAETVRWGDYYRKETETVQAEGAALRHLLIFVRILTTSFVRDFIIRRFLIAREELVLKSCITREIKN